MAGASSPLLNQFQNEAWRASFTISTSHLVAVALSHTDLMLAASGENNLLQHLNPQSVLFGRDKDSCCSFHETFSPPFI